MRNFSHHLRTRLGLLLPLAILLVGVIAVAPAGARQPGPNGRIAFDRFDPLVGDSVPYTANPDGSHQVQLLPFGAGMPRWSADGTHIATAGSPTGGSATVTNVDDGTHVNL